MDSRAATGVRPYQVLDTPNSIRLLQLHRNEDSSITGHLEIVCLDAPDCQPFTALSYTWGNPGNNLGINLHGQPFPIRESLYPILEAICTGLKWDSSGWYWIDAICINQADVGERASQVQLMGRLYATAARTAVWLSPATSEMDLAMDFFVELSDWNEGDELDFNDAAKWSAWGALLQLPWWRRVWTLQECVIPRRLDFHCGCEKSFSREQLHRAMHTHGVYDPHTTVVAPSVRLPAWNRRRIRQWFEVHPDKMGLFALMAYTGNSAATDPRDRVYGVLGLATHDDRLIVGHPTYAEDVEIFYRRIAVSFVKAWNSLDVICFAELFRARHPEISRGPGRGREILPSWVPDWRTETETFVVPFMVSQSSRVHIGNFRPPSKRRCVRKPVGYTAAGNQGPRVSFSDDNHRMTCSGIILDTLDGLGECLDEARQQRGQDVGVKKYLIQSTSLANNAPDLHTRLAPSQLLDQIIRCMVLDRQDRDLATAAPLDRFRLEFLHLTTIADKAEDKWSAIYHHWFTWLHLNESLRIKGTSLRDLIQLNATEASQPHLMDLLCAAEDGMASRLLDTVSLQRMRKRLATTENGYVGMAPLGAKKGDAVCILFGCSVPVVLRSHGTDFEFIGECFVDGYMEGEILTQHYHQVQEFTLT